MVVWTGRAAHLLQGGEDVSWESRLGWGHWGYWGQLGAWGQMRWDGVEEGCWGTGVGFRSESIEERKDEVKVGDEDKW